MKLQTIFENKILIVVAVGIVYSIPIIWDHYHGGVPVHYLLHSEDMPGFSNWWGILTIPVLTWAVITTLGRRYKENETEKSIMSKDSKVLTGFLMSLIYGILLSVFWEFGLENILQYLILLPIVISLFKPVHLPEYLLGFVLGLVITFGGVLPIIIGIVLVLLCLLVHNVIRKGFIFIVSKLNKS